LYSVEMLGRIGDPSAVHALKEVLLNSKSMLNATVKALSKIGTPEAKEVIAQHKSSELRIWGLLGPIIGDFEEL